MPGKFHGMRRLVRCSPWGHKKLDATEATWHIQAATLSLLACLNQVTLCYPYCWLRAFARPGLLPFLPSSSSSGVSLLIFCRSLQQDLPLITPLKRHNPTQAESFTLLYLFAVCFPTLEYKVQEIKNWDLLDSAPHPQCLEQNWHIIDI